MPLGKIHPRTTVLAPQKGFSEQTFMACRPQTRKMIMSLRGAKRRSNPNKIATPPFGRLAITRKEHFQDKNQGLLPIDKGKGFS
jgi:hypothetical protein